MAGSGPEGRVLVHPGDDFHDGSTLLGRDFIADAVRDHEGMRVSPGGGMVEEGRDGDCAPIEQFVLGPVVSQRRAVERAVSVGRQ